MQRHCKKTTFTRLTLAVYLVFPILVFWAFPALAAEEPISLAGRSLPVVMAIAFGIGFLLNATPCVYPVIPITISFFGSRGTGKRRDAVFGALAYWAGITAMYSALGTAAAMTGGIIGQALSYTPVIVALVAILVALALSMFGLWELRMPQSLTRAAAKNRGGLGGAFFMGLLSGILAAPCAGPVVAGLMGHVAEVGSPLYGFAVFMALSLGLGLPLAVVAMFSDTVAGLLPRAGEWMIWVRKLFGFMLLTAASYVALPLVGLEAGRWIMGSLIGAAGVYLGFVHQGGAKGFVVFKKVFGVAAIVAAVFVVWTHQAPDNQVTWEKFNMHGMNQAVKEHRPIVIKFTADWCAYCIQMQRTTFADPRVVKALGLFKTMKVDMTKPTRKLRMIQRNMGVTGLPTVVFIDGDGDLMHQMTLKGYVDADEFLLHLKQVFEKIKQKTLKPAQE